MTRILARFKPPARRNFQFKRLYSLGQIEHAGRPSRVARRDKHPVNLGPLGRELKKEGVAGTLVPAQERKERPLWGSTGKTPGGRAPVRWGFRLLNSTLY